MITHEERKTYYDKDYYDTDKKPPYRQWWWSDSSVWAPRAKAIMVAFSPSRILDCGCAKGSLIKYLFSLYGVDAYGFDYSEYAISTTPFPDIKDKLLLHDIVSDSLPFDDKYFDSIIAVDFFEHIEQENLQNVINEICRVTARHILIRQPFFVIDEITDQRLSRACCGLPIPDRWDIYGDLAELSIDKTNVEHPSTVPRQVLIQFFNGFTEFIAEPYIYDVQMGATYLESTPVFTFYNTLLLRRDT